MGVVLTLYLLAVLDCAFASYRSAGGRNAAIIKGDYYARAMVSGALIAQAPVAVTVGVSLVLLKYSSDPSNLFNNYVAAGSFMLQWYIPYAVLTVVALLVRCFPCVDTRSLSMVLVLGPFTFLRPLVALAGVASAYIHVRRPEVLWTLIPTVILMLLMQPFFDRRNRYPNFGTTNAAPPQGVRE